MTFTVFLAVLGAALLHASWNAVLKQGNDKLTNMLVMTGTQGMVGLAIAMTMPWPKTEAWPQLVASGVLQAFYKSFLVSAYEHGDLSRVYPIARETALRETSILQAVLIGWLIFGDKMGRGKVIAAGLILKGVVLTGL